MIIYRSTGFYLLIIFIVITFLSLINIISLSAIEIVIYALMIAGVTFFYSSFIKQYKAGITLGAIIFFTGTILFVLTKFEIWNLRAVWMPSVLIIIGLSLLSSNLLTQINKISILVSILCLFAGVWLLIARGTATIELFLSALFEIAESYWIIILVLAGIIFLTTRNAKKNIE